MPEEKLTRAEWERVCNIERLEAQIAGTDTEIQELQAKMTLEIQKLEAWKITLAAEIARLGG